MAFPQTPLPARVRIAPGADPASNRSTWTLVDITSDVRIASGIDIEVGRADEGKKVDNGKCTLTVNNKGGHYSTRCPAGRWFGALARNTPIEVDLRRDLVDTFARTVSGGWGTSDSGDAWTGFGAGGSLLGADWAVSGGTGTLSVPIAGAMRASYLAGVQVIDSDIYATVSTSSAATGGPLEPLNILSRLTSNSAYYMYRATVETTGAVTAVIINRAGATLASVTVPGLTYTPGMSIRGRAQTAGTALSFKVWNAAGAEPSGWTVTATDAAFVAAGAIGVRSGVASGNTAAKPITFSWSAFSASVWVQRFTGTVPEWLPRWDLSGKDAYVPITAAGIVRRLQQGASPLRSVLYRSTVAAKPAAYWSLEEEATSASFAEARGGSPMAWAGTPPKRGSGGPPGSAPLVTLSADTSLIGNVAPYTETTPGWWGVQTVLRVPDAQGQDVPILNVYMDGGTYSRWQLWWGYYTGIGGFYWITYDQAGVASGQLANAYNLGFFPDGHGWGHDIIVGFNIHQNGANIALDGAFASPDDPAGTRLSATATVAGTNGKVTRVEVPFSTGYPHTNWTYGHISVWPGQFSLYDKQMYGWDKEPASDRIARLCAEQGVPVTIAPGSSEPMGPQGIDTFLNLLRDCEDADEGTLYEAGTGLGYIPRAARYNPAVSLALDFKQGHIAAPPEPTDDDQRLRNDITCKRPNGSFGRYIDTTSNNAVAKVGLYDEQVTINVATDTALRPHSAWRVHLGTIDEMRWPRIEIDLAAPGAVPLIPAWLACGISARTTIANPPPEVAPGLLDLLVEGYHEHLNVYDWKVTANCSPVSAYRVFVVNTDRVDGDGYKLTAGVNETAATLSVTSTTGLLWGVTSDPNSSFPFDIEVAGIRLRVTGITGSTSPQTFNVTRSMDGFDKPLSANAPVRLWHPPVIAL